MYKWYVASLCLLVLLLQIYDVHSWRAADFQKQMIVIADLIQ